MEDEEEDSDDDDDDLPFCSAVLTAVLRRGNASSSNILAANTPRSQHTADPAPCTNVGANNDPLDDNDDNKWLL